MSSAADTSVMEAARRIVETTEANPDSKVGRVARALIRMQESNRTLADALERLLYAVNGINQGGMAITPEEMAETNRDCQEVHKAWSAALSDENGKGEKP